MNRTSVADAFSRLNTEIFPFAYSLIYDELQAQQVIIDSISIFMGKESDALSEYCDEEDFQSRSLKWFEIKKVIYDNVFKISKKRFDQVRSSLSFSESDVQFYALSITQRAVLFLKYKSEFEETDIIDILNIDYIEFRQLQATSELNISKNYNGEILT